MDEKTGVEPKLVWSDQQAQVIDTRCGNLLVSAAAGSGKTAVLVERIIEMVTGENSKGERIGDGIDIDELLVVTFTNAAAAQMKEKIGSRLRERIDREIKENGVCDEHLIKQMTLINHADICTIDSFCLRIVKEYFSRVELDSAFDIGDETEMKLLRQEVMDEVMELCCAQPGLVPDFTRLVDIFAKRSHDTAVAGLVFRMMNVVSSYPEPEVWFENAKRALDFSAYRDLDTDEKEKLLCRENELVKSMTAEICMLTDAALDMAKECRSIAVPKYGLDKYCDKIDRDVEMLSHMNKVANSGNETMLFSLKRVYEQGKKAGALESLGRADKADEDKKKYVRDRRGKYKKLIEDVMEIVVSPDDMTGQAEMMKPVLTALINLTRLYAEKLMEAKRDRNIYEFHDIEEFAFRILCNGIKDGVAEPSEIGLEVSGRYREILIDEYQDSNFLQEYILSSVSGHKEGLHNIFMVGDVKQSIYRFRMARPDLFIRKYDSYVRLGAGDEANPDADGSSILLTRNFRSEINVLRTTNAIFRQLMHRYVGGIEYDRDAELNSRYAIKNENGIFSEPLDTPEPGCGPKSEFVLIENDTSKMSENSACTRIAVEAAYIASRIDALVNGPEPLIIGRGSDRRRVSYGDIVILLRSISTVGKDFDKVFESAGIPLRIENDTGYFDAAEVSVIISMLSIVDNSYIDYDLAAVLRSPLAGVTDEELAIIAGEYRISHIDDEVKGRREFFGRLMEYMKAHETEDTVLMRKLKSFRELLYYLKFNKNYMSISDMIRYILDATGYYWYVGARPMGRRRQANIDMLMKKADDFEKNSKGVFAFIRYVSELRTHDLDFAEAEMSGGNEDVVRIMTMHKSKGLQFPVLFVAGLGREFNMMDQRAALLIHPDYYLSVNAIDSGRRVKVDSFFKKAMARLMNMETYAEEMRVLYVALTRAEEKLYMTACVDSIDSFRADRDMYAICGAAGMNPVELSSGRTFADWIYSALSHVKCSDFVDMTETEASSFIRAASNGNISIALYGRNGEAADAENDDEKLCAEVRRRLDFDYGHRQSGLKSKLSVTEIKNLQQAEAADDRVYRRRSDVPVPGFLKESMEPEGNEIGTIYHKIMELADFSDDTAAGAARDVDEVFDRGLFNEKYRQLIRPEKIQRLLSGRLGRRMADAGERGQLHREKQFYAMLKPGDIREELAGYEDESIVVQGIIDAYFVENGGIILVDYKTDTVKSADELTEKYHVQLDKYAQVLEQLTGMPVKEKIIYSFCLDCEANL